MTISNSKQVKFGAILYYVLIVCTALYGIIITPFIVSHLGSSNYGIYKTISSLSASLAVIDLGVGGTIQRYVAKYIAEKNEDKISNFVAMGLIISTAICFAFAFVSIGLYFSLNLLYGKTLNAEQMEIAKIVFCISALTIVVHVFENVFNGVVTGYNHFVFGNGIKVVLLAVRIVAIILFLSRSDSVVGLVALTLVINLLFALIEALFVRAFIKLKIKLTKWEKGLFFEAGKYTVLMFLTSIVGQICTNLDNVVIGAIRGPELVTIYSIGLLIFAMFSQLSCGISGVMLPTVTNVLNSENGEKKIIDLIIKAGRIQFLLLGAGVVGFLCIGKDFVYVWMGPGFEDVYIITLVLIIPALFELCINVCLSILQAKNLLVFRTISLCISATINAIITIVLVKEWSYIGAAIGTAISYILCSLISMNWYYHKKLKLPMLKIYKGIIGKIVFCQIIAGVCLFVFSRFVKGSWFAIFLDVLCFCLIYLGTLFVFGLNKEEKRQLFFWKKKKE